MRPYLCELKREHSCRNYRNDDDNRGKLAPRPVRYRLLRRDILRSLDSFRRQLEGPRDDERDWESNRDQRDHQPDNPGWNFQEWKNLRGNLHQQPADDRVGNRNFVNIAPLQLGEEIAWSHFGFLSQGPWK